MAVQNVKKAFAYITDYNPSFKTMHASRRYATGKLESCLRELYFGEIERYDLFIDLLIQSLFPYYCRDYARPYSLVFEQYAVQNA